VLRLQKFSQLGAHERTMVETLRRRTNDMHTRKRLIINNINNGTLYFRCSFNAAQIKVLEYHFDVHRYITSDMRRRLAYQLRLTEQQVCLCHSFCSI
jgi:hypothetical protein